MSLQVSGSPGGQSTARPAQQIPHQTSMRIMVCPDPGGCCVIVLFHKLA